MRYIKTFENENTHGLNQFEWMILEIKPRNHASDGTLHIVRTSSVSRNDMFESTACEVFSDSLWLPYRSKFTLTYKIKSHSYFDSVGTGYNVVYRSTSDFNEVEKVYKNKSIEKKFDI